VVINNHDINHDTMSWFFILYLFIRKLATLYL
jgi:hypothetical protein